MTRLKKQAQTSSGQFKSRSNSRLGRSTNPRARERITKHLFEGGKRGRLGGVMKSLSPLALIELSENHINQLTLGCAVAQLKLLQLNFPRPDGHTKRSFLLTPHDNGWICEFLMLSLSETFFSGLLACTALQLPCRGEKLRSECLVDWGKT
jgi:hypothetical protein